MPEQITPLSTLYLLLHGAGTAVSVVLCLYLLLCRGKAIAPDITPPARLRRWAAALFGAMALAHVWWILFYTYSDDTRSVVYGLLVAIDCMVLPPVFVGTLLTMLQDRRRPLWPIFVVMTPCAVIAVLQTAMPSVDLTTPNKVYGLILVVAFIIYMVVAVRQYGRWLRDNYADLEHKEVWVSHTLVLVVLLLLVNYGFADGLLAFVIVQLSNYAIFALLAWRVETLPTLNEAEADEDDDLLQDPSMRPEQDILPEPDFVPELAQGAKKIALPNSRRRKAGDDVLSRIGQLLEKECVGTQLYLKQGLTLSDLSAAVGVNRNYLGQYFASQGTTYYNYIHDLRINHFMRLCRDAVAARRPFKAQQLALDSGFRSYSTFASAFKQRTGQSVASWVSDLEKAGAGHQ